MGIHTGHPAPIPFCVVLSLISHDFLQTCLEKSCHVFLSSWSRPNLPHFVRCNKFTIDVNIMFWNYMHFNIIRISELNSLFNLRSYDSEAISPDQKNYSINYNLGSSFSSIYWEKMKKQREVLGKESLSERLDVGLFGKPQLLVWYWKVRGEIRWPRWTWHQRIEMNFRPPMKTETECYNHKTPLWWRAGFTKQGRVHFHLCS